ncbi:SGNH/GDSL hydrolase family protein, partial [Streptomyces sp. YIM 98790]|uniref:SGNH/GDSL hydrolase family protein n=1 Tax=Streptomyces sp. YIM 98790 TaxID=2689077 RepID=UPI0014099F44
MTALRPGPGPGPGPGAGRGPAELRFAALGDSLTEGVGDPLPGGGWRGWAALLAESLGTPGRPVRLVNLARSGARTPDTAGEQLAGARRHRPHLASVIVGGNDILRSAFDLHRAARDLDTLIGTLTADGAVVLTACLPDPGRMLRLPAAVARPLARRMRSVNELVHQLSRRHRALHAHFAEHPVAGDRACWSVDRLHPSERGHRLLAREFHALLTARGLTATPPPADRTDQPPPTAAADLRWMATRGARWALDRSRDLLPGLLRLAAVETAHRFRGTTAALDAAARASVRTALLDT